MSHQQQSFLRGIFPALVTPLNADDSVNLQSLERLIERMYDAGANGLYLCGSTGEGLRMQPEARQLVTEVVKKLSPEDKQIIVHVGADSLEKTLELARHASGLGVSAVSSLPLVGMSAEQLPPFYRAIASAASVPVVAYYFPGYTGYTLNFEQLAEICDIPGVEGVKYTDYDLYTLSRLTNQGVKILNGRDEILIAGLIMGATGGIGSLYNIIPESFVAALSAGIRSSLGRSTQASGNGHPVHLRHALLSAAACDQTSTRVARDRLRENTWRPSRVDGRTKGAVAH